VKEDWPEYGKTLEDMLRSVRFSDPEGTYTSEDLGLKIWYPQDWYLDEGHDQVILATSYDTIDKGDLGSGAALLVQASSLGSEVLADWFEDELRTFTFDQGGVTSDLAPRIIGSQEGLIIDIEGRPAGTDTYVTGFVAAAAYDGWGYLFLGVTNEDEWADYGLTLGEMLDSVQFVD